MSLYKYVLSKSCIAIILLLLLFLPTFSHPASEKSKLLSVREISLLNRQPDAWVNDIFKKNILLTFAYAQHKVTSPDDINWNEVEKPFTYTLVLAPHELFAFHDGVLPQYKNKVGLTMNAHFNYQEGFKYDGYLVGDGVCHLASLLYWVAKDAQLEAIAPTNHDFAHIESVPREFGVSIFSLPGQEYTSALQNLYLTNNRIHPIHIEFIYNGKTLKVTISELT